MVGVTVENILHQVAQLPLTEQQFLKQVLRDREVTDTPPTEPMLSLAEAAQLLNVSTRFVESLVIKGELFSKATDLPPIFRLTEVLAYKKRNDDETAAILDELTAQAQELKMGYE